MDDPTPPPPHRLGRIRVLDRATVAAMAIFNLIAGGLIYVIEDNNPLVASQWLAVLFVVAGIAGVAHAILPSSRELLALAGAFSSTAYTSRAIVLAIEYQRGYLEVDKARAALLVLTWAAFGWLIGYVFLRFLKPLTELRRLSDPRKD